MIKVIQRLEFADVFPEESEQDIIDYLKNISRFSLLNIIGYSNTKNQPNFGTVFSNPNINSDILKRVYAYASKRQINPDELTLISRESSLRLSEVILANRKELLDNNTNDDRDTDEINLYKAYLVVNKKTNSKQNFGDSQDDFEILIDFFITLFFPVSDLPLDEDNDKEFAKLLYCTLTKFESLIDFLQSDKELSYLEEGLYQYFGMSSMEVLKHQVVYLYGSLFQMKYKNGFKWTVEDGTAKTFLESLVGDEIVEDDDFTNLKNYPIYRISENVFSVVDYFFVLDKFFKSTRFVLKEKFNQHHGLKSSDRTFFDFYNTQFSENHLMVNVLDSVFHKKYFIKKKVKENVNNEPDYYVRHNKRIFLFEHKDVLIRKNIKSSGDIDQIYSALKGKFLETGNKPVGIGQLITSIEQILEGNFEFDDLVVNGNYEIYPILLVTDRIFDTLGLNYRMNEWFQDSINIRLGKKHNLSRIKPLTLIDMNTLIYWLPHLSARDRNMKDILDKHHSRMLNRRNVNHPDKQVGIDRVKKGLALQLSPISNRFPEYRFPMELLIDKFKIIDKSQAKKKSSRRIL